MAPVHDAERGRAGRDLGQDGGDEPLHGVQPVPPRPLPCQRPLQPLRHALQRTLLLGRLPERPDDHRHRLDGPEPLPPHVPDHHADAVRGVGDGVQVAAHELVRLRRLVPGGHLEPADPLRRGWQHGPHGGLRDDPGRGQLLVAAPHDAVDEDGQHGGGEHGEHLDDRDHPGGGAVGEPHRDDGQDRGDARADGPGEREERRGDQRGRDEQGDGREVGRGQ